MKLLHHLWTDQSVKHCLPKTAHWHVELRPDPSIRAQNELLLKATFLRDLEWDDDEDTEGSSLGMKDKEAAAQFLLSMDTGDWSKDGIVHHCSIGCCRSAIESRMKLWVAIQVGFCFAKTCPYSFGVCVCHQQTFSHYKFMNFKWWIWLVGVMINVCKNGLSFTTHISFGSLCSLCVCWVCSGVLPEGCSVPSASNHACDIEMDDMCQNCPDSFVSRSASEPGSQGNDLLTNQPIWN